MNENIVLWNNVAALYDAYRPHAPAVILDLFTQLIAEPRPRLVVDLGCGTGLSTFVWAARAQQVIGIEPNDEMRELAETRNSAHSFATVQFRSGLSTQTGLLSESADIVTCSQCLHWMEPEPTFAEIARILRPGGLFAAYDYSWPPTINWEAEAAHNRFVEQVEQRAKERGIQENFRLWSKSGHLSRLRSTGNFRYVKEIYLSNSEPGNAERFIGLALSNHVGRLIHRLGGEDSDLDQFKAIVKEKLGDELMPWYMSYRVVIGIK